MEWSFFLDLAVFLLSRILKKLSKKATKAVKAKFDARIRKKQERVQRSGKATKKYYTTGQTVGQNGQVRKTFTGGKDLQSTATYPTLFCTMVCRLWSQAFSSTAVRAVQLVQHEWRRSMIAILDCEFLRNCGLASCFTALNYVELCWFQITLDCPKCPETADVPVRCLDMSLLLPRATRRAEKRMSIKDHKVNQTI